MAHLLVVDDDMGFGLYASAVAEKQGWTVTSFTDAREAIAAAASLPFDAVLTDMIMPDLDGLEFLDALAAKRRDIRVIATTSYNPLYLSMARSLLSDRFDAPIKTASKPLTPEALGHLLKP